MGFKVCLGFGLWRVRIHILTRECERVARGTHVQILKNNRQSSKMVFFFIKKTVLERNMVSLLLRWFSKNCCGMKTILRRFLQNRCRMIVFIYRNTIPFLSKTIFH